MWLTLLLACQPDTTVSVGPPSGSAARACRDTYDEYAPTDPTDPVQKERAFMQYDFERCKEGCDVGGDFWSCSATATVYATGKGLTYDGDVDFAAAVAYAEKSCAAHGSETCPRALEYRCRQDPEACEGRCRAGERDVCVALADPYDDIGSDAFDKDRSVPFLELACAAGHDASCGRHRLLVCATDPLACQAKCDEDLAHWCWQMGWQLERGSEAMPKNPEKGRRFALKACELDEVVSEECPKRLLDAKLEP